jgi:hypothetical protein
MTNEVALEQVFSQGSSPLCVWVSMCVCVCVSSVCCLHVCMYNTVIIQKYKFTSKHFQLSVKYKHSNIFLYFCLILPTTGLFLWWLRWKKQRNCSFHLCICVKITESLVFSIWHTHTHTICKEVYFKKDLFTVQELKIHGLICKLGSGL